VVRDHDNLRAAFDWLAEHDDVESAHQLVDGVAWTFFARSDPHQAVRWLDDASQLTGPVTFGTRAITTMWHAYFIAFIAGPDAEITELQQVVAELRTANDTPRLRDGLLVLGELYNRMNETQRSLDAVAELRTLLGPTDQWVHALADSLAARNLASLGRYDEAEEAARSSIALMKSIGQEWLLFEGLGLQSLLFEAKGDFDAAVAAYEEMLRLCADVDLPMYESQWIMRLAMVRARQGLDDEAERLFGRYLSYDILPTNRGWGLIGRAGALRRRGDTAAARADLDAALALYDSLDVDAGRAAALAGLCWWAIDACELEAAAGFANEAVRCAAQGSDLVITLTAETALAATAVIASGAAADREQLVQQLGRRAEAGAILYVALVGGTIGGDLDEPDVAALAQRLGLD
jgi:tetratricopeptide (TPR) repeat protein